MGAHPSTNDINVTCLFERGPTDARLKAKVHAATSNLVGDATDHAFELLD